MTRDDGDKTENESGSKTESKTEPELFSLFAYSARYLPPADPAAGIPAATWRGAWLRFAALLAAVAALTGLQVVYYLRECARGMYGCPFADLTFAPIGLLGATTQNDWWPLPFLAYAAAFFSPIVVGVLTGLGDMEVRPATRRWMNGVRWLSMLLLVNLLAMALGNMTGRSVHWIITTPEWRETSVPGIMRCWPGFAAGAAAVVLTVLIWTFVRPRLYREQGKRWVRILDAAPMLPLMVTSSIDRTQADPGQLVMVLCVVAFISIVALPGEMEGARRAIEAHRQARWMWSWAYFMLIWSAILVIGVAVLLYPDL